MPSRLATAFFIAACTALVVILPTAAFASEPDTAYLGAEVTRSSALSVGEILALVALGFIPALVMIAREKRAERHGG